MNTRPKRLVSKNNFPKNISTLPGFSDSQTTTEEVNIKIKKSFKTLITYFTHDFKQ